MKDTHLNLDLNEVYTILYEYYGPQGWWPLFDYSLNSFVYCGKTTLTENEHFEIILGAILTQNVSWNNVETCFKNLAQRVEINLENIEEMERGHLGQLIRPSGYYNQKTIKIHNFIDFLKTNNATLSQLKNMEQDHLRRFLLAVKGIGPETADSISLYSFNKKIFVIDAYTNRVFQRLGIIDAPISYNKFQELFHEQFNGDVKAYKEYHALIVMLCKDYCRKKPLCEDCPVKKHCRDYKA